MAKRVGGNAPCPCRSRLKFKNCCGLQSPVRFPSMSREDVATHPALGALDAAMRRAGQEHGIPVPSIIHQGQRIRAIRNTIYARPPEETFHEFLFNLVKWTFGEGWYRGQLAAPAAQKHQVMRWFIAQSEHQRRFIGDERFKKDGKYETVAIGADQALLTLGYDLFHVLHRGELPKKLLKRLRQQGNFQGARHELAAAAIFVRARFEVKFVEERSAKHPEFIARDPGSGARIAVEAKSRHRPGVLDQEGEIDEPKALRADIENLIDEALAQNPGDCPFMIFVDLNVLPVPGIPMQERAWFHDVQLLMQSLGEPTTERPSDFNGLFLTNAPYHWEISKPAPGAEYLSIIPGATRHPLAPELAARVHGAVAAYGSVPIEV